MLESVHELQQLQNEVFTCLWAINPFLAPFLFKKKKRGGGTNTDNVKYEQTTRHHIDNFQEGRNSQGFTMVKLTINFKIRNRSRITSGELPVQWLLSP